MRNYIEIFSDFLVNDKKASKNTYESYIRDINQFSSYCALNNISDLAAVDNATVKGYLEYLLRIGKSEATKTRIVASLRAYYKCLVSKKISKNNPVDNIKVKRVVRKLPGVLDSTEILKLLSAPDVNDYKGVRDKAMLELLYATGIKVSELIDLSVNDVNLQIGILHLHSDKNERVIPIYPAAVKSITDYLLNVRSAIVLDDKEDKLFTNMTGQPMSRQGFWKIIKHYADEAGIDKDITPHTLRHSFAAHLLENGAKLSDIKEMLGHSDISSTQIYAQLMKSKYSSVYSKFHPLAK